MQEGIGNIFVNLKWKRGMQQLTTNACTLLVWKKCCSLCLA